MPDIDLNNLMQGTVFVTNHQDRRDSFGWRTRVLREGVSNVGALANKTLAWGDVYWPGTTVPLERTLGIKKDGGRGVFVDYYRYPKGRNLPGEDERRVEILPGYDTVDWYPVWTDKDNVLGATTLPVTTPGGKTHKQSQSNPGKYGRKFILWRLRIPFDIREVPLSKPVRKMANSINKNFYTLSDVRFPPYTLRFLAPSAVPKDVRGTLRYRGWYEYQYREDGWRRMDYADGQYYKLLMHEPTKFVNPPH